MRFTLSGPRASLVKGRRPTAAGQKIWRSWRRDETGAVAVLTALCLGVFIMLLALVLDIGHIMSVRSELQNAADASALAGARALPQTLPPGVRLMPSSSSIPNCSGATAAASNLINSTDAQNIAIAAVDIELGHWGWPGETILSPNFRLNEFVPLSTCSANVNAIRVTARKDPSINQPVTTWFARILGIETVDVTSRQAIAAQGYANQVLPGRVFPVAINQDWLNGVLAQPVPEGGILFNPDKQDNGGWAAPPDQNPNAADLKNWVDNGWNEEVSINDMISLANGVDASVIQEIKQQLKSHTPPYPYTLKNGASFSGWMVLAPVVGVDKFTGETRVLALQPMIITGVNAPSEGDKTIQVVFYDQPVLVSGGLAGGAYNPNSSGLSTIPRLVQ